MSGRVKALGRGRDPQNQGCSGTSQVSCALPPSEVASS